MSLDTSTHAFEIVEPATAGDWDDFVAGHPKGTIFHTAAMVRAFAAAKGHAPLAIAARDAQGALAALLVAVRVDTLGGPARLFASRSVFYAEPICRNDAVGVAALTELLSIHDRRMAGTLFAEVRPIHEPGPERSVLEAHGYQWSQYLNYVVDLESDEEELYRRLQKSLRRQLRRNAEKGVVIRKSRRPVDVERLHSHLQWSYARSKVPLADVGLFRAALAELPPHVPYVRVAYFQGAPIASGICLAYKDRTYAWYGGSQRLSGISADDSMTWHEILFAKRQGSRWYDFGGAGWPEEEYGPRDFKAKFGGELVCYGRYRKVFSRWRMKVAETAYEATRRLAAPAARAARPRK